MGPDKSAVRKEYTTKAILISIFLGILFTFIAWMTFFGPGWEAFQVGPFDLVLLGLSTYRLGRLVAYERVMEPVRQFFTKTVPDPTGAGDTVEAKGSGFQQAIGQLISCPICSGTWIAAGLVYLLYLFPGPVRVFLVMTSAIGIGELLGALTEALCWTGQYGRVMSGMKTREQEQHEHPVRIDLPNGKSTQETVRESEFYNRR